MHAGATTSVGDLPLQREQFKVAWEAAKHMPDAAWQPLAAGLESYPLYPYLQLASIDRRMSTVARDEVEKFLATWAGSLPAKRLRADFLRELARRRDWRDFADLYIADQAGVELRCDDMQARLALGRKVDFDRDFKSLWLSARKLPDACDPVSNWAVAQHKLTTRLVWQRIDMAGRAGNARLIDTLAGMLRGIQRQDAKRIAAAIRSPAATLRHATTWPDSVHARTAAVIGISRLAPRDSAAAAKLWPKLRHHLHFSGKQRNHILHVIALNLAADYAPDAMKHIAQLPAAAMDATIGEWRVRVALADGDWKDALIALNRLPRGQRDDAHWRYLRGRVLAMLGDKAAAAAQFSAISDQSNYFGFLAADWLGQPYTICPERFVDDTAADRVLQQDPSLVRAFEFFAIDALPQARSEWNFAMARLNTEQRRLAAHLAAGLGWHDRAVYAFSTAKDMRLYDLRFPLVKRAQIIHDARANGLDPAWAYAIIRAESAWTTDAHSGADAYGLMQLLPATARRVASAQNQPLGDATDLFDPQLNIHLGTQYLGNMAIRYDGSPWLATAAYNAGPDPVAKWINARDTLPPDFFIETIPYKETREYVARVLAFSVIYDWRLHGSALPLVSRLPRIGQPYSPPAADAPRKQVICPSPARATVGATAMHARTGQG